MFETVYRSCRLPFGQFQQKSAAVRAEFTTRDEHCPSHGKYRRDRGFYLYLKNIFPKREFLTGFGGGWGGRGEGTDLPKLLKTSLNIYIHILKSSIFTSVSACMCERRRGKCYSYNFKTVKSYSYLDLS